MGYEDSVGPAGPKDNLRAMSLLKEELEASTQNVFAIKINGLQCTDDRPVYNDMQVKLPNDILHQPDPFTIYSLLTIKYQVFQKIYKLSITTSVLQSSMVSEDHREANRYEDISKMRGLLILCALSVSFPYIQMQ